MYLLTSVSKEKTRQNSSRILATINYKRKLRNDQRVATNTDRKQQKKLSPTSHFTNTRFKKTVTKLERRWNIISRQVLIVRID